MDGLRSPSWELKQFKEMSPVERLDSQYSLDRISRALFRLRTMFSTGQFKNDLFNSIGSDFNLTCSEWSAVVGIAYSSIVCDDWRFCPKEYADVNCDSDNIDDLRAGSCACADAIEGEWLKIWADCFS